MDLVGGHEDALGLLDRGPAVRGLAELGGEGVGVEESVGVEEGAGGVVGEDD